MQHLFLILLALFLLATLAVLIMGIFVMGRGRKTDPELSNKLMVARICMQASAVLMILLLALMS